MSFYTKRGIIPFSMLLGLLFVLFSFSEDKLYQEKSLVFQEYAQAFQEAVISLDETATQYKLGQTDLENLQAEVKKARLAYKKIEFYLTFYHNDYVGTHINAAPLLHIEKTGTLPKIVEPEGLQVLDELVYSADVFEERSKLSALATKLRMNYGLLYEGLQSKNIVLDKEITAMRLELVRVFTLGLTGFDTPGSLNAIEEAKTSLQSMRNILEETQQKNRNKDLQQVLKMFDGAVAFLNSAASFEDLDRLKFLQDHLDPLYRQMGKMQGKKDDPEFLAHNTAWNGESTSIFSQDFLNPYFFTELEEKEDSKRLRSLGKTLFYDPALSGNQKMNCASCHNSNQTFTDAQPKSLSNIQDKTVLRNAPTLINAVYADRYFYDLRAFTLEQQVEHVIFNSEEYDTAYSEILEKLQEDEQYTKEFKAVFGKGQVNRENFSKALASYILSLSSFNSDFDKYVRKETPEIDPKVKNGFNLFMGKANCATCHFAPTFSGLVPPLYSESESEILGVLKNPSAKTLVLDPDTGRLGNQISSEEAWIYERSFKTTTVRNAELTAPYFHNGAYNTLEEVMEFYDQGGGEGMGNTVVNQTLPPDPLNLTTKEKEELIAFIKSLTDNPFVEKEL